MLLSCNAEAPTIDTVSLATGKYWSATNEQWRDRARSVLILSIVILLVSHSAFPTRAWARTTAGPENLVCHSPDRSVAVKIFDPYDGQKIGSLERFRGYVSTGNAKISRIEITINGRLQYHNDSVDVHTYTVKKAVGLLKSSKNALQLYRGLNTIIMTALSDEGLCNTDKVLVKGLSTGIHAIIVGISTYKYVPDLQFAHNDATDFEEYLIDSLGVPRPQIHTLINEQADAREVRIAFDKVNSQLSDDGSVVVYFSGHGYFSPASLLDDTAFLVPHDGDPEYPGTLLPKSEFVKSILKLKAKRKMFFLDSCFSGAEVGGAAAKSVTDIRGSKDIIPDQWVSLKGVYALVSSQENELSWEFEDIQNGIFTYYLLKAFTEAEDANGDGFVNLSEASAYVKKHVQTDVFRREQVPQTPFVPFVQEEADKLKWGYAKQ